MTKFFQIRALLIATVYLVFVSSLAAETLAITPTPEPFSVLPSLPLIVLDPGHGGEDHGAFGPDGLVEKTLVLTIAQDLRTMLEANRKARVAMTRENDVFVPLAERTKFANQLDAAIFISLHANASPKRKASGFETYYLDNADDQASRKLAERENAAGAGIGGGKDDLSLMLSDLIQVGKLDESIILAHTIHKSVLTAVRPVWPNLRDLGVKKAPFYVLVGAHMPCILVELFFIDHPLDSKMLADSQSRQLLVEGMFKGIVQFILPRFIEPRAQ